MDNKEMIFVRLRHGSIRSHSVCLLSLKYPEISTGKGIVVMRLDFPWLAYIQRPNTLPKEKMVYQTQEHDLNTMRSYV